MKHFTFFPRNKFNFVIAVFDGSCRKVFNGLSYLDDRNTSANGGFTMKDVTGLSKGEIERLAQEIERDRALLFRIGNSFQLIHSDVVRLSQVLDEKIVEYMKLKQHLRLANQQSDANNQNSCSND